MSSVMLSFNIEDKSLEFIKNSLFIDCVLHSGDETYNAHRIVLARFSKWFCDYLKQEEEKMKQEEEAKLKKQQDEQSKAAVPKPSPQQPKKQKNKNKKKGRGKKW